MAEENPLIPGVDPVKQPHKSLLKRIDIGLLTAILALLISFIGIITAYACLLYTSPSPRDRG